MSEEATRDAFSDLAKVSAWSLFRSLFSQITSQANMDLPALPANPQFNIAIGPIE
jgi:hypothetical protein